MPELPDVEIYKHFANDLVKDHEVESVDVKDKKVLKVSPAQLKKALVNNTLGPAERLGKYLLFELSSDKYLAMHFGMTGELKYFEDENDLPEYSQLVLNFKDGGHLAYVCKRKFGKVLLTDSVDEFKNDKHIGPDALELSYEQFKDLLHEHSGMVKPVLLNQSIISGIGNVYADEILYNAKIHPKKPVNELSDDQMKNLFNNTQKVLNVSIAHNADPGDLPGHYLISHRHEGEKCPDCNGTIEKITVGARSSYYCPSCQKME